MIIKINAELGVTVLIITHQMDVVAKIADGVSVLENGELIEHGAVDKVFSKPQHPLTRRFVDTVVPSRLPEKVAADIASGRVGTAVRVTYREGAARDLITDLSSRFEVSISLLHATEAPLRRTTVGTLVLGITGTRAIEATNWASTITGLDVEVLS